MAIPARVFNPPLNSFRSRLGRSRRRRRDRRGLSALGVAFDVAGGEPRGHFIRLAPVFVVHDRVQSRRGLHPLLDQRADGGGVAHAAFAVLLQLRVGGGHRRAVVLQIRHEERIQRVRHELPHQPGFRRRHGRAVPGLRGQLPEKFIGEGEQRGFVGVGALIVVRTEKGESFNNRRATVQTPVF